MKKLYIDVMVQGGKKFYCSLIYTYNPLFKIDLEDVAKFVNEKRPTVKYQKTHYSRSTLKMWQNS